METPPGFQSDWEIFSLWGTQGFCLHIKTSAYVFLTERIWGDEYDKQWQFKTKWLWVDETFGQYTEKKQ